ncbi:MAG: hypothetical protein ACYTXY_40710 [Nostoc sp.]
MFLHPEDQVWLFALQSCEEGPATQSDVERGQEVVAQLAPVPSKEVEKVPAKNLQ